MPYNYFSDIQLYDIKVEYKNVVGGPTDGSGDVLVPSDSSYVNHLVEGIASRITVLPNVAFHRECEVYGDGLTIATAGVQATFAIQSKDAYNNLRGVGGDPAPQMNDGGDGDGMKWAGALSVEDGGKVRIDVEGACPTCPRLIRANVVDNQDSTYTAYFTGTQKGRYTVVTSLAVRVDPFVDWSAAQVPGAS